MSQEKGTPSKNTLHVNKPKWLKTNIPTGETYFSIKRELRKKNLFTVCEEAKCPNIGECWSTRTATFMILGDTCTRACRFCNVKTGQPSGWIDPLEPEKTAESVVTMGLSYAVITMVDRDDLADFGAEHIQKVLVAVRSRSPQTRIEFLGGDMQGQEAPLRTVLEALPTVFAHNLETVERLTPRVRDARASFRQSLEVLAHAKQWGPNGMLTKSALMVGLGETKTEIISALKALRTADVDIVTIGQYMRPAKKNLSIKEFIPPEVFDEYQQTAKELGFLAVASAPLVRSSYKADVFYHEAQKVLEREGR